MDSDLRAVQTLFDATRELLVAVVGACSTTAEMMAAYEAAAKKRRGCSNGAAENEKAAADEAWARSLLARLDAISSQFAMDTAAALASGRARDIARIVAAYGGGVDVVAIVNEVALRADVTSPEIARLLEAAERAKTGAKPQARPLNYTRCDCGGPMVTDSVRSALRCDDCGALRDLPGTVFDDTQFYCQDGQKIKSGAYKPNRHFQHWMLRIMAQESDEEISSPVEGDNGETSLSCAQLIDDLRALIVRNNMVLRAITIYDTRALLQMVGRSDLNKNAPLIMKKLTGIGPPPVPSDYLARIENLFTKATEIGDIIERSSGRVNRNNYPYTIFRIVEAVIPEGHPSRRLLYYIYLQNNDTVARDDQDWKIICAELKKLGDDIAYTPTDDGIQAKYAPI